ncbi:MAG: hypothetical protein IJ867_01530 [Clostridia bacterium]|nr:hypothetical protein [Clostridia bacterium]
MCNLKSNVVTDDNANTKSDYLDFVEAKFVQCFRDKGFEEKKAVNITSQIDDTVDFIGSKISVMKPFVLNEDFGSFGRFIIQNSIKLKALKCIRIPEAHKFGSYYKCMGTISKPDIERMVCDTFDYFTSEQYLNIPFDNLCIKICSQDDDLMHAIKGVDKRVNLEIDKASIEHYRHKYGMEREQITGRDFNIGVKVEGTNKYFTCATFVLMESPYKKIGIDMGIGNCSLSMCKFNTASTVSSSRMADLVEIDSVQKEKFADALIATSIMFKEEVYDHPSNHFRKKYRQYLNALMFWNEQFKYSYEELADLIVSFLNREYKNNYTQIRDIFLKKVNSR